MVEWGRRMKKITLPTIIALVVDVLGLLVLCIYFIKVMPQETVTDLSGLLILTPPFFGLVGIVPAILGFRKNKGWLGMVLIVLNIVFLLWWPIFWVGGTLLFGV